MKNFVPMHENESMRFNLSAVFAGSIIALALQSLFNLLGLGSGLFAFTPDAEALKSLGSATIIWLIITSIVSMFGGSWVAAKSSAVYKKSTGMLYGLVTWGVATVLTLLLISTSLGLLINETLDMVTQTIHFATKQFSDESKIENNSNYVLMKDLPDMAKKWAPDLKPLITEAQDQARDALDAIKKAQKENDNKKDKISLDELKNYLSANLPKLFSSGEDNNLNIKKQEIIDFLVNKAQLPQDQAEKIVNKSVEQYQKLQAQGKQKLEEMKHKAIIAAEETTDTLGSITLILFFASLLGCIASLLGGYLGVQNSENNS